MWETSCYIFFINLLSVLVLGFCTSFLETCLFSPGKAEGEDGEGLASRPESAKPEEKTDQEKTVNGTATQTTQTASKGVGGKT